MSKTVDERVVEMRFDNRQFEQNVADDVYFGQVQAEVEL